MIASCKDLALSHDHNALRNVLNIFSFKQLYEVKNQIFFSFLSPSRVHFIYCVCMSLCAIMSEEKKIGKKM